MRFRKLRIAWSVFCGIACVLLIVLWVRSYWVRDYLIVDYGGKPVLRLGSIENLITFEFQDLGQSFRGPFFRHKSTVMEFGPTVFGDNDERYRDHHWVLLRRFGSHTKLFIPHWLFAL